MYKKYTIQEFETSREVFIKANEELKYNFYLDKDWEEKLTNHKLKLRILGDQGIHPSWMWEGGYPYLYRMIDDALCQEVTHHSQFSLKITMNNEDYRRRAYYKIDFPASITPQFRLKKEDRNSFKFKIYVKAEEVKCQSQGQVKIIFEKRFFQEDGTVPTVDAVADEIISIPVEEGTYDWRTIERVFECEDNLSSILVYITAEYGEGILYFEDAAFLSKEGHNLLPQFTISNPYHQYLNWFGENLSRKEWTDLEIILNGDTCFNGEVFQRTHRWSEKEIKLASSMLKLGKNEIIIKNKSDYFCPYPYKLKAIQLLFAPNGAVNVVSCPKVAKVGGELPVLIDLKEAAQKVEVSSKSHALVPVQEIYTFKSEGLNVVKFKVLEAASDLVVSIKCGEEVHEAVIERTIIKEKEDVLTGTGDAIYVPQVYEDLEDFLAWYVQNAIGNFITFRPVYRWCGTRVINEAYWERMVSLCNELGLYYCHMVDGRELPGLAANPTKKMLQGEYFVGNQGHERDGAYYYWGSSNEVEDKFFHELCARTLQHEDFKYLLSPKVEGRECFAHFSPKKCKDMEEAANYYVENAKMSLAGIKRHSGPSVLFKYFYQAGLENAGGELMYGPHEVVIAAQRGAALAYNKKQHLAHLAVQWSTTPHDTIERFRRYQLALFVCYTHGVDHINTEEGLWRMEEYFSYHDRFDKACIGHQKVQQEFTHFVATHSRKGEMKNSVALIHGKNDAWACFGRRSAWAHEGEEWKFNYPEESWDLIKVFYPDSVLSAIYRHPCEDKPQGYYTRTPYGAVDILPIEAEENIYKKYPAMAFMGWNTAEEVQFDKLIQYVEEGGKLVLSWAHLFTTKLRVEALSGTSEIISNEYIHKLLGIKDYVFDLEDNHNHMARLTLEGHVAIKESVDGQPLVIENHLGKGEVTFVNAKCYPADVRIRNTYERLLENLGQEVTESYYDKGYIVTEDTVNFTVYDTDNDLRTIYLLNMNWWDSENAVAKAELKWKDQVIDLDVPREKINILTLSKTVGVYTCDNETEILDIREERDKIYITLQGMGETDLRIITPWSNTETSNINCLKVKLSGVTQITV